MFMRYEHSKYNIARIIFFVNRIHALPRLKHTI
jgi:hypothetical protein